MGGLFSRKKKDDKKLTTERSESYGSVWVSPRDLRNETSTGIKSTVVPPPASAPKIQCPPGCVTDPNYVPPAQQEPTQDQGLEPCPKSPIKEEPCPGKDHHVTSPPGTEEETEEVIPQEKEPPYGTGPYKPEPPPVFEAEGKDAKQKKEKNMKPDPCEIKDFEAAAKIKRKKGVDPCNPEAEGEKKKAAQAAKDAKARTKDEPKGPTSTPSAATIDPSKDKPAEQGPEPCPPSEPTPPPPAPPKDPKQEAKEKKERERKAKEDEKKRLEEEKKKKEAEKKKLEEEKKAQEKERKRLEDEKKAKVKAEKEKAAKEVKEAKEKAAREAKEAKEKAAKELKEKKEAEAAKKKKEEEEKKLEKQVSDAGDVKSSGDKNEILKTVPKEPPWVCPPGCIPDPGSAAPPPPPPPTELGRVCPPGCIRDPNEPVQNFNNEPVMGTAPCPQPPNPPPPMPADPCIVSPSPSLPQAPSPPPQAMPMPPPPELKYPQAPCQPGAHNCPTCEQELPPGKQPAANEQHLTAAYCQRHGYYLTRQNFGTRPSPTYPAQYGYGMPEPIHVPECPVQRHNSQCHERPNTPYHIPQSTPYLDRPGTPYTGGPIAIDATGCCHSPLTTRQVTHFGTRQCQFSHQQNEYDGENDQYAQGAIVPLTDQPTAIIPGGAVLYIGGTTDKPPPNIRYMRQRTPSLRIKHISLPKLPYISLQGVSLDDVQAFYDPLEREDTIRLVIKRKKQRKSNNIVRDSQRSCSLRPGDVKNANFAIKSSDDFEAEGLDRFEFGRPLVRMNDEGMFAFDREEMRNRAVVKRNCAETETSVASKDNKMRGVEEKTNTVLRWDCTGKLEFVNFNVADGEKCVPVCEDKKKTQEEAVDLENDEECDDEMEELIYDDDDMEECDEEPADDLMFTIEDTGEDCMDIDEVWIEEEDDRPEAEQNDECDDDEEDAGAAWAETSVQPPFIQHDQNFKFEPLDEPENEPTTLENRHDGSFDVTDLSSLVSRMTDGVEFEPSDSSVVADDGDPTVELPETSTGPRTISPMSDGVSSVKLEKVPSIIKFGAWVKNVILPDYKK